VLVKMDLTDDAWHLVKNTPKVTGFPTLNNVITGRIRAITPEAAKLGTLVEIGRLCSRASQPKRPGVRASTVQQPRA
jgi:hypothetical protein